eukprot:COSAG05_NODE_2067_length_3615_cov_14.420032_3_plen_85_part_00
MLCPVGGALPRLVGDIVVRHVREVGHREYPRAEKAGIHKLPTACTLLMEQRQADAREQVDRGDVIAWGVRVRFSIFHSESPRIC